MGVVILVNVKCYYHGFNSPPSDYALNIGNVVGFYERTFKQDDGQMISYVKLDTTSRGQLAIAGTMAELFATIEQADRRTRGIQAPYYFLAPTPDFLCSKCMKNPDMNPDLLVDEATPRS